MHVPLSKTEAAFVEMCLEEHKAMIRNADLRRDQRMAVLLNEKAIPDGKAVQYERQPDGSSALTYPDTQPE